MSMIYIKKHISHTKCTNDKIKKHFVPVKHETKLNSDKYVIYLFIYF